jgi:ATP-dependent Lhr-like helicase
MLISVKVELAQLFGAVRAVVVDEVHAFGSADQGWHLLAVLERVSRLAGRPVQRIDCRPRSGVPSSCLTGSRARDAGSRPAGVVASDQGSLPPRSGSGSAAVRPPGEVELDYVGSVSNAAQVIASLHGGDKRLVFCDSRQIVEELGAACGAPG